MHEWRRWTDDPIILDMIEHYHVEFDSSFFEFKQEKTFQHKFNAVESEIIGNEIHKLVSMGVLKEVQQDADQFLSPLFVRPKKNGEYRMILNLKGLNKYIPNHHFKMDTFEKNIEFNHKRRVYGISRSSSCVLKHSISRRNTALFSFYMGR